MFIIELSYDFTHMETLIMKAYIILDNMAFVYYEHLVKIKLFRFRGQWFGFDSHYIFIVS